MSHSLCRSVFRSLLFSLTLLGVASASSACDDDDGGEHGHHFDNLPACVDEHSSLAEAQSIAHCLVDFPELHPEFADQQACVAFVEANGGYPDSREAACVDYFIQTGS